MGLPSAGQVVNLLFPFSDLSDYKYRPGVIIAAVGREDWIVCQITSNPLSDPRAIRITFADFSSGGLQHVSYVRPAKIFTAHASLIRSELGELRPSVFRNIRETLLSVIREE